ncbi:MAG: hypothetical protein ACI4PK_02485 [Oscillospiraceae bacterium]
MFNGTIDGGSKNESTEAYQSLILVDAGGQCFVEKANLQNNEAVYGGAIYNKGKVTIKNSVISGCSAEQGGAIFNKGVLSGDNVTIKSCHATKIGGAVVNSGNNATFNAGALAFI